MRAERTSQILHNGATYGSLSFRLDASLDVCYAPSDQYPSDVYSTVTAASRNFDIFVSQFPQQRTYKKLKGTLIHLGYQVTKFAYDLLACLFYRCIEVAL